MMRGYIDDFKAALSEQAKAYGFTDWEIYYSTGTSFSVKIFGGEIAEYKNTDAEGLSFRGTFGGRIGYAFTEKIEPSVIPGLLENAATLAGIIDADEIEKLYPGDASYPKTNTYNPALETVAVSEKIRLALAMEKSAYAQDARVKSVDYCQLGTSESRVQIANSYGLDVSEVSNFAYAYAVARVEDKGGTKTGTEIWHGNDFGGFSPEAVAKKAVARALSYLNAESVESGAYPVIFDNRTACDIMAAFASVFFGEDAQKGFSLLAGKTGEVIAAPHITLRDDGSHPKSFGNVAFDSEGVAAQQKAVIENGVLKTLLYNTKSAEKEGVKSTGNGFRASFRAAVGTACTNFYIVPGQLPPAALQERMGHGVLITELSGLHAGVNTVSGDFSVSADGFWVEGGKIIRPVEQITVAGNFYALLKDIEAVADDLRFDIPSGSGAFGMPSVWVKGLKVAGL